MNISELMKYRGFLGGSGGSGGGSSAPSDWNANEGEPGHILNRPFYSEKVVGEVVNKAFKESDFDGDVGGYLYHNDCWLYTGEEYNVFWGSTKHSCTCVEMQGEDEVVQLLGNVGALTGGESTGEPFIALIIPHVEEPDKVVYTAMFVPLDGETDGIHVEITGLTRVVHEVPQSYLKRTIIELKNYTENFVTEAIQEALKNLS